MNKRLFVYVTECASNDSGRKMKKDLDCIGVPSILVLDASVGYILEQVDLVLVGAEGVVESGGIVNAVHEEKLLAIVVGQLEHVDGD